jgi:hypothetical protein
MSPLPTKGDFERDSGGMTNYELRTKNYELRTRI